MIGTDNADRLKPPKKLGLAGLTAYFGPSGHILGRPVGII
jgi:hypothetical protein